MARRRTPTSDTLAKLGLRTAGVAHDLAQPLTAALLAARQVDGRGAAALREALHRMEDLLLALRDDLHPGEARRKGPASLADIRRAILSGLTTAERRRVRLRFAGTSRVDPLVLQRILGNLVLNALRHGQGPVTGIATAEGGRLAASVEGGAGKAAASTGWGIGLASCQDLAGRHGLTLRVEITPEGSKASLESRT